MSGNGSQPFRVAGGTAIDRSRPVRFAFDGKRCGGYAGDTLASALLANGVHLVARSFKYHRPRGIFASGVDEPNALLEIGSGARLVPNARATMVELEDAMQVRSQNCWPSLRFDVLGFNARLAPLLRAGFYYKTFMAPRAWWPWYEKLIRRAAGMGCAPRAADPDRYEHRHTVTDILIVGAGAAGLAAAWNAAQSGLRVLLVDEQTAPGGWLRFEDCEIDGAPGADWAQRAWNGLAGMDNVTLLSRTTAFGLYDHNSAGLLEAVPGGRQPRERLWTVRARQIILATGAIERPIPFACNDLPGIMLAGAARAFLSGYGVLGGRRVVVLAGNDSAYRSAFDLQDAGAVIGAVVDLRPTLSTALNDMLRARGIESHTGSTPLRAAGTRHIEALQVRTAAGNRLELSCDLLCVSAGWTPTVQLYAQRSRDLRYEEKCGAFVPGGTLPNVHCAGTMIGAFATGDCIVSGAGAARAALAACGATPGSGLPASEIEELPLYADAPAPLPDGGADVDEGKSFVDLQNDVTLADLRLACNEGYDSVEHLKRYTTLGMGTDQGRTSNLVGLQFLSRLRGVAITEPGVTTSRPPYTPVTLGALAGPQLGAHLAPLRRTPLHGVHAQAGAVFGPNGLWLRPKYYARAGESQAAAIEREAGCVRNAAGICDISTLGKFELVGADAPEFLKRVFLGDLPGLPIGAVRYGVMLREDAMVFDDGTVTRLGERRWFLTSTSGNAESLHDHFDYLLAACWPTLDVTLACVTEQWAGIAIAGPRSRELLQRVLGGTDLSPAVLPHMHTMDCTWSGRAARLLRVSYSGELGFEMYVPAGLATDLWQALTRHGADHGLEPYGLEAMDVLRIEKGHFAIGAEADGRVSPLDLGLERLVRRRSDDFIGRRFLELPGLQSPDRGQLIGLRAAGRDTLLREGTQLLNSPGDRGFGQSQGCVSSAAFSPALQCSIGLALLRDGRRRIGTTIQLYDPVRSGEACSTVTVVEPCFFDPAGGRMRA